METVISSSQFLQARKEKVFLPVVRENRLPVKDKLPRYLGSILYVDMSNSDWAREPLRDLLRGIRKCNNGVWAREGDRNR